MLGFVTMTTFVLILVFVEILPKYTFEFTLMKMFKLESSKTLGKHKFITMHDALMLAEF